MSKKEKVESSFSELRTTKYLVERIQELQSEIESLKFELERSKRIPSEKVGVTLTTSGIIVLVLSVLSESQILAFIGLSLTFWGFLFFFIKPIRYVKGNLLDSAATSTYITVDRIVNDLKFKGRSYYIPPYPKDVYLPEYLRGLKEMVVFISADTQPEMPSIEEIAKSKFLLKNPNGICISPPGLGLLNQIERELREDVTKVDLETLLERLPQIITESLELAKEVEMKRDKKKVYVRINDSIYKNLYKREQNLKSVHFLGCPLASAIACAIAKASGKIVTIEKDNVSTDFQTIEFWYSFVED